MATPSMKLNKYWVTAFTTTLSNSKYYGRATLLSRALGNPVPIYSTAKTFLTITSMSTPNLPIRGVLSCLCLRTTDPESLLLSMAKFSSNICIKQTNDIKRCLSFSPIFFTMLFLVRKLLPYTQKFTFIHLPLLWKSPLFAKH